MCAFGDDLLVFDTEIFKREERWVYEKLIAIVVIHNALVDNTIMDNMLVENFR